MQQLRGHGHLVPPESSKVHVQKSLSAVLTNCSHEGLRIKENKEVYEGEVTELTPEEAPSQTGGYGKVISHVVIGLKSVKGTKQLKLDPTIYDRCACAPAQTSGCPPPRLSHIHK